MGVKGEEEKQWGLQVPGLKQQQGGGPGLRVYFLLVQVEWRVLARVFVPGREVGFRGRRQQQGGGIDLYTLCRRVRNPTENGLLGRSDFRFQRSLRLGPPLLGGIGDVSCSIC